MHQPSPQRLDQYGVGSYHPGASFGKQLLWFYLGSPLVQTSLLPFSSFKVWLLRCFGATIGHGVRLKPGVKIKFPWKITIGHHCWIGENTWFDNIAPITIGDQVCVSQGVYLCTGNHDWSDLTFSLKSAPITLGTGSWLGAKSVVGPGVIVEPGAILTLGSVAVKPLAAMTIYAGNPALPLKPRPA